MTISYGFYNSKNGDRKYNTEQISSLFDGIIKDGVFNNIGKRFSVTAGGGNTLIIGSGRAWFNHTWTYNDTDYPLSMSGSEVLLGRYDAVVIEIDTTNRTNSIKKIDGTPSSSPSKPKLSSDGGIFQYPLAYIYRKAGSTSISQSNIEYMVGKTECPIVVAAVQNVDISDLVAQWQTKFDEWFSNLETQLSGDVAGNLQNQINNRLQTSKLIDDKESLLSASSSGFVAGAKATATIFNELLDLTELVELKTSMFAFQSFYNILFFKAYKIGKMVVFNAELLYTGLDSNYQANSFYDMNKALETKVSVRPNSYYKLNITSTDAAYLNAVNGHAMISKSGLIQYSFPQKPQRYIFISGTYFTD